MIQNPGHFELIVIGSGPSGRRAAIQGAKLGKRVLLVERGRRVGGVSVHTGTLPSKTMRETVLNLSGLREREFYGLTYQVKKNITAADIFERLQKTLSHEIAIEEHQYHRNKVEVMYGDARFDGPHSIVVTDDKGQEQLVSADYLVIAVGTRPFRPDYIPFDGHSVIDSDELLQITELPGSMAVVGAGVIGLEYATIFSALSVHVTIIDPREKVLDFVDREIIDDMQYQLKKRDVALRLGYSVDRIATQPGTNRQICYLSGGRQVAADLVLFAAGRVGATDGLGLDKCGLEVDHRCRIAVDEHFQTAVPHIYAVGDVIGFPSLASTSMEQGRHATCHIFGESTSAVTKYFPYGIYSVPEISMVGMTEEEVRQREIPYEIGIARFRETARGQIMGLADGMLKCIFSLKTHRLLGVHIVGEGATELIHIGQAVMAHKGCLEYFLDNTFNYPTLAEGYKVAALDAWNRMPH